MKNRQLAIDNLERRDPCCTYGPVAEAPIIQLQQVLETDPAWTVFLDFKIYDPDFREALGRPDRPSNCESGWVSWQVFLTSENWTHETREYNNLGRDDVDILFYDPEWFADPDKPRVGDSSGKDREAIRQTIDIEMHAWDTSGDKTIAHDSFEITTVYRPAGDASFDGVFDSHDLVLMFQRGKFETDLEANWRQGDFDGDGDFDTSDLVAAFQEGAYRNE